MFASEQLVASQKAKIIAALSDTSKYASRSLGALAKLINESAEYTDNLLEATEGVKVNHEGSRSGKTYFSLAGS
jgi:hypothetical protein